MRRILLKTKMPQQKSVEAFVYRQGIRLELIKILWRRPTLPPVTAVPSALRGLTSLFGMGRGGPPRYSHPSLIHSVRSIKNLLGSYMTLT